MGAAGPGFLDLQQCEVGSGACQRTMSHAAATMTGVKQVDGQHRVVGVAGGRWPAIPPPGHDLVNPRMATIHAQPARPCRPQGSRRALNKSGAVDPAGEATQMAMDQQLPLAVVCRVLGEPRSTVYARRGRATGTPRPGPADSISDNDLLELIHTASRRGGSIGTTKRSSNLPLWGVRQLYG